MLFVAGARNLAMPAQPASGEIPSRRKEASAQRRQAVLDAGLEVFSTRGFAAARLDDVAERAGVAKGTIYLFFKDKEDLFEQIVLGAAAPVLARIEIVISRADLPLDEMLSRLFEVFQSEILATKRKKILRLVITEGVRFPKIAEFYYREVIAKGLALIRRLARTARARGELSSDEIERFPQLVFAPLLMTVVWEGLFSKVEPLDVGGLLRAHRKVLLGSK
jgi:AcrR family transcriptional regulator